MKKINEVILIRPSYGKMYHSFEKSAKFQVCAPPTGLLFIAGMLKSKGIDVSIIDGELLNLSNEDIEKEIKKRKPKIVGITGTIPECKTIKETAKTVKLVDKKIVVVVGGAYATTLPNEVLQDENIDFVVRGEGELTMLELCEKILSNENQKKIKGISYREEGRIIHNLDRELIKNIDELPYQARELVPIEKYTFPAPKLGIVPLIVMFTTRGCPFQCIFCNRINGSCARFMSPKVVVDEMEFLYNKYNIKFLQFNDETFILNHKRVFEICDLIIERKLNIKWFCMVRSNLASKELFKRMKKAGCIRITMGVETGNQNINNILKKGTKLEQYERAYKWAKQLGIETRGSFIIGNPYDTMETIKQTIKFAKRLKLDEAYFNIMTPYPGTEIYLMAKKNQGLRLLTEDYSQYERWGNAVIELPTLSGKELIQWQKKAHRSFYLRLSIMWHQFRRMGLKDSIKAASVYIPVILKK